VAREGGGYGGNGLEVTEHPVASSVDQIRALLDGDPTRPDQPDNVATYRFNAGNRSAPGRRPDRAAGRPRSGLSLLARVTGWRRWWRAAVAVDVPASGFAFALYAVTEAAGLRPERTTAWWRSARRPGGRRHCAGDCGDAAQRGSRRDAEAVGRRRLARVVDVAAPTGAVLAARGDWLTATSRSSGVPAGLVRGDRAGARLGGERRSVASRCHPPGSSLREGVIVDSLVDLTALRTVVDLRERWRVRGGRRRGRRP
jgi:hypothetical protein